MSIQRSVSFAEKEGLDEIKEDIIELIESNDYKGAIARIEYHLHSRDMGEAEIANLYYLHATCLHRIADYTGALRKVEEAWQKSRTLNNPVIDARQRRLLGMIRQQLGNLPDALEAYNESSILFKNSGDYPGMLGPLVSIASIHFLRGEYKKSLAILEETIETCRKYSLSDNLVKCVFNSSRVRLFLGDFRKAQEDLDSLQIDESHGFDVARIHNLRGMILVYLLDYDKAELLLMRARDYYQRIGSRRDEAVCGEYLGLNEAFQGNYKEAEKRFLEVLELPQPTASARAQSLRMLTDVNVAKGDFLEARKTAVKAEDLISKIDERIEHYALYRAWGQICEHDGDEKKAREYFAQSIDLLDKLGARYELALSHFAIGNSESYTYDERREHLLKARGLFEVMGVPKRVQQVEQAIVNLRAEQPRQIDLPADVASGEIPYELRRIGGVFASRQGALEMILALDEHRLLGRNDLVEEMFPGEIVDAAIRDLDELGLVKETDEGIFATDKGKEIARRLQRVLAS